MTGSGTQADPYIVENYADFLNMKAGTSAYYRLGTDIDFSQYRNPDDPAISVKLCELDGNGHTLSNFFRRVSGTAVNSFFTQDSRYVADIKNLNFTGAFFCGGTTLFFENMHSGSKIQNCRLGIKVTDEEAQGYMDPFFGFGKISDCEIFFEGQSNALKTLNQTGIIEGSLIKYNMESDFAYTNNIFGMSATLSGICGKIIINGSTAPDLTFIGETSTNSYYAVDVNKANSINIKSFSGTNFYDSEVMRNVSGVMPSSPNFHALTTEQCKNAGYLQSIGFPCVQG